MELALLWIILSILAGVLASNRGFTFIATFLLSLILSPLIGFVSVLVRTPRPTAAQRAAAAASKKCPFCAETIKAEAVLCRYCGRDLPTANADTVDVDARFEDWLRNQEPPIVNPTPSQRAEYRAAFDYKLRNAEL